MYKHILILSVLAIGGCGKGCAEIVNDNIKSD